MHAYITTAIPCFISQSSYNILCFQCVIYIFIIHFAYIILRQVNKYSFSLKILFVCGICVCGGTFLWVCMCTGVWYGEKRVRSSIFLTFWFRIFHWTWGSPVFLNLLTAAPSLLLSLPSHCYHIQFSNDCRCSCCAASILPSEPSSYFPIFI